MERTDVDAFDHASSSVSSCAGSSHETHLQTLARKNDEGAPEEDLGDLSEMMSSVLSILRGETGAFANFQRKREEKYLASRNTPERLAKSQAKISELTGTEPDRPPILSPADADSTIARNSAFTSFWLPWAQNAQYVGGTDIDLSASSQYGIEVTQQIREIAHNIMSWAVPSPPVLEFISKRADRIVDVGAGTGYWAALLADRACDVLAIDADDQPLQWHPVHKQGKSIPDLVTSQMGDLLTSPDFGADVEACLRDNDGCADRALFMCWPRRAIGHRAQADDLSGRDTMAEKALEHFRGDIIFYVGEWSDGATFDMQRWLWENEDDWQVDVQLEIPVWPGLHDSFSCLSRKTRVK